MKTYEEIMEHRMKDGALGDDFQLREVSRWNVHCAHCGTQLVGDTPQTDKAFEALKRTLEGRECRNPNCVANGGTEQRREALLFTEDEALLALAEKRIANDNGKRTSLQDAAAELGVDL